MTSTPWHYSAFGLTTVGDGTYSLGEFPVNPLSVAASIENALSYGAGVVLLKGIYDLDRAIEVEGEGKQIVLAAGCEIRNAASGSVGCFKFKSPRQVLISGGGKIVVDTWVDSQKVISATSGAHWFRCRDLHIDVTATSGNTTTPMTMIHADTLIEPEIVNNVILPNKGVRGIHINACHGGKINNNRIRNETITGMGSGATEIPTIDGTPRKCYEGIRADASGWFEVMDNFLWNLGDATDPVNFAIVYNKVDSPTGTEQGHFRISRNRMEAVAIDNKAIGIFGGAWFSCDENKIGWCKNLASGVGDAAIYFGAMLVAGVETPGAGGEHVCASFSCRANEIHFFAVSHTPPIGGGNDSFAVSIFLNYSKKAFVTHNMLTLVGGYSALAVDVDKATEFFITSNWFSGSDAPEHFISLTGTAAPRGVMSGNFALDSTASVTAGDFKGIASHAMTSFGYSGLGGGQALTAGAGTITFTTASNTIAHSANGLGIFDVGQWIWISGAATAADNGFRRVATRQADGSAITVTGPAISNGVDAGTPTIIALDTNFWTT